MKQGYVLKTADGRYVAVADVKIKYENVKVFNLHVAKYYNYFVSASDSTTSILVHNNCGQKIPAGREVTFHPKKDGMKAGVEMSEEEAVKHAKAGGDFLAKDKRIAEGASESKPKHHYEPHDKGQLPHYHPFDANGGKLGHIFY